MPTVRLTKKQTQAWKILEDKTFRRIFFDGASRSGKTSITLLWLIYIASKFPGTKILIARKFLAHAKKTIWKDLCKIISKTQGWDVHESDLECRASNGSSILVDGLDDKERVEKILGSEYLIIFINECTQVAYDTVTTVMTRLSQKCVDENGEEAVRKLILDCNPSHKRHWAHAVGVMQKYPLSEERLLDAELWKRLNWTVWDNADNLPSDYFDTLDALPEIKRKRMRDGIWCDNEGLVYDEFDEDIHVIEEMPQGWEMWPRVRGVDFGYVNPFACLSAVKDGDGRLYFFVEHYKTKMLVEDHAKIISAWPPAVYTVSDHDSEDRETLHRHGVPTIAAKKDIRTGIDAVKARLKIQPDGRSRIFFLKSAMVNTINEIYSYRWPEGQDGKNDKEVPVDDANHAMDTVRYIVMQEDAGFIKASVSISGERSLVQKEIPIEQREEVWQ